MIDNKANSDRKSARKQHKMQINKRNLVSFINISNQQMRDNKVHICVKIASNHDTSYIHLEKCVKNINLHARLERIVWGMDTQDIKPVNFWIGKITKRKIKANK